MNTPHFAELKQNLTSNDLRILRLKEPYIKSLFPQEWTPEASLSILRVGFGLKLLGFDWKSTEQLARLLAFFEMLGFVERNDTKQVRANPCCVLEDPNINN